MDPACQIQKSPGTSCGDPGSQRQRKYPGSQFSIFVFRKLSSMQLFLGADQRSLLPVRVVVPVRVSALLVLHFPLHFGKYR